MDLILPISLKYQLSKAFGIAVGAEINSSLFAKSKIEANRSEKVSENTEEIVYKNVLTSEVNTNTQAIPRFGVSGVIQGQLSITANQTIALGVNYRLTRQLQENRNNSFFIGQATHTDNKYFRVYLKYAYSW